MTQSLICGAVHRFGDHVDTDQIISGRHLGTTEPAALAPHCMAAADPGFAVRVRPGDVLLAGENFGCGSSREHAPIALLGCGIAAVVASSFARIFFRSALNIGLPVVTCPGAAAASGDDAELDLSTGQVRIGAAILQAEPLPAEVLAILAAGGLVPFMRARLRAEGYAA